MSRPRHAAPIPPQHGVSPSSVALPATKPGTAPWATLLDFLAHRLPAVSRETWATRLAQGEVLDEDGRPLPPDAPYRGGSRVHYFRSLPQEPAIPFAAQVVFADDHLVVADKPHFLPVTPSGRYLHETLLVRLKRELGIAALSPLHRIDRETAGLVAFSVRPQDRNAYQALFRDRAVRKRYQAIAAAPGALALPAIRRSRIEEDPQAFFRMLEVPGEPNSETHIELAEQQGAWGRYTLEPLTGKRHQLRVHMNALGLPIVGDQFYPRVLRGPEEVEDFAEPLRLLAQGLAFTDPVTGQARRFESALLLDWPAG